MLDDKLLELRKEINRIDSLAFKDALRKSEHALERLVEQLSRRRPLAAVLARPHVQAIGTRVSAADGMLALCWD